MSAMQKINQVPVFRDENGKEYKKLKAADTRSPDVESIGFLLGKERVYFTPAEKWNDVLRIREDAEKTKAAKKAAKEAEVQQTELAGV